MDNILKAIITAGVTNLVTNSLILAISLGWLIYLYALPVGGLWVVC